MHIGSAKFAITLCVVLAFGVLSGCATDEVETDSVKFNYVKPDGSKELADRLSLLIPSGKTSAAAGEARAWQLAEALKLQLKRDEAVTNADKVGEILRLKDERYRIKVYMPSGMVKFRDTVLHNRNLEEDIEAGPLAREEALDLAGETLQALVAAKLVREDELVLDAAMFSFRKEGQGGGAATGQVGRPSFQPSVVMDTRVLIPRAINGIGVFGHGVRLTFSNTGKLTGLDLLWRDVALDEKASYPLRMSMEDAKRIFETSVDVTPGSTVDVLLNELVYDEPSRRAPVSFLEPVYLFVYRARVPIEGGDEFIVSKRVHRAIAAVDHGMVQLTPPRRERLAQLQKRLRTERPTKAPVIKKKTEGEE